MNRRHLTLALTLSLTTLLGTAACGKKQAVPDIKIGLIAELSGDIPAVGASCKNAAEMAVAEINLEGGVTVAGQKHGLRLVVDDSAAKADQAASAAQKLITQDEVLAVVGPNASLGAIPAAQIAEQASVLLITPWSTNPKTTLDATTNQPKKWVFRACFNDLFQGTVLAKFAVDYMHKHKAAVLYDVSSEAPKGQAELFKKDFEANGGTVVAFETYTTGDRDFTAQLTKIKAAGPELVFLPAYYTDVPLQMQQAHRLGLDVPFLGSDTWSSPELIKLAGADAEGAFFSNHYSASAKNEITGTFVVSYKKRYGQEPDDVAALTYDAFRLLQKALNNATALDRAAVRNAFAKISDYTGVTGKMTFKPGSGDPVKSAVMMKISGGKFTWVTNVDPD